MNYRPNNRLGAFAYINVYILWVLSIAVASTGTAHAQTTLFANLQQPVGIETDRVGNVYVGSDAIFTTYISMFASNSRLLARTTLGGITVGNNGHIVRVPNSDDMLLLANTGMLYRFLAKNLGQPIPYFNLATLNYRVANGAYDVSTKSFRNIALGALNWGDIAAYWARPGRLYVYLTATSNGFPLAMRLTIDTVNNRLLSWRVIATSTGTTAGTFNQPRGIAVNAKGWVLTGFPYVVPNVGFIDSIVAFPATFPETQTVKPQFVLKTTRTRTGLYDLASVGMTSDATGNFYVASGVVGGSLCGFGGSSAIVVINPIPTTPNPRCTPVPSIYGSSNDVAVSPVGNIPYLTFGNYVLRFDRLAN